LSREEFEQRYHSSFKDPASKPLQRELDAIVGPHGTASAIRANRPLPARHHDRHTGELVSRADRTDWLTDMSLISAGGMRQRVSGKRPQCRALGKAVTLHRAGKLEEPGKGLVDPNPK
jgi:hypothetical protein